MEMVKLQLQTQLEMLSLGKARQIHKRLVTRHSEAVCTSEEDISC